MIQKHNNSTWQGKAYSKIVDTTQQVTAFPVVVRPMENTIPSWTIKGNMSQTGTPTPQNPIQPQETGERTGNLWAGDVPQYSYAKDYKKYNPDNAVYIKAGTYTISTDGNLPTIQAFDLNHTQITTVSSVISASDGYSYFWDGYAVGPKSGTIHQSVLTLSTDCILTFTVVSNIGTYIMLNTGSTALPYEPYGYKIPISSANTTTPVYLGEVESTRKIKKYEFTGSETWNTYQNTYYITVSGYYRLHDVGRHLSVCSHFPIKQEVTVPEMCYGLGGLIDEKAHTVWNGNIVFNPLPMISSLTDWKSYLAQQYAAGTPVTIWYVLSSATTGILNEPIRKIGTYSDSVSGTNLSVTAQSPTTIDVDTSLKPSEMDLTYTGKKMCKRKKRVNGAWV